MEQSPHRARGLVWLQVEHTSLVLRLTQVSCIWNSGPYSRDASNLWLRTTAHTSGSPWSQACDLQLFWVSSLHTAYHGMLQVPSIINQILKQIPSHISFRLHKPGHTVRHLSRIDVQLKTAAKLLCLSRNMLNSY